MNKSSLGLSIGTLRILVFSMFVLSSKISIAAGEKINYPQLNWSFSSVLALLIELLNKEVFKFTKKFVQDVMDYVY